MTNYDMAWAEQHVRAAFRDQANPFCQGCGKCEPTTARQREGRRHPYRRKAERTGSRRI